MGRNGDVNEGTRTTPDKSEQNDRTILTLIESPSFEGSLSVRLAEQHIANQRRYVLHCTKTAPLGEQEATVMYSLRLAASGHLNAGANWFSAEERAAAERYFQIPLIWLREVPLEEAELLIHCSRDDGIGHVGERRMGLDGTTYHLVIHGDEQPLQIEWWGEPPASNVILRKVVTTLLKRADLERERRKCIAEPDRARLMKKLEYSLQQAEVQASQEREVALACLNEETRRIATLLESQAITCPHCGRRSQDIRYLDKRPGGRSYFICLHCGRSFGAAETAF